MLYSDSSCTYQEHLADVEELLRRISRSGLRISLDKLRVGVDLVADSMTILGFKVKAGEILPDPRKLDAIKELSIPTTLVQLQRFLGMLVYFRKNLPLPIGGNIAKLHQYASANKFTPTDPQFIQCFHDIQENLRDLTIYTPQKKSLSLLYTDASRTMIGGILLNIQFQTRSISQKS